MPGLIPRSEVLRLTSLSKSDMYRKIKDGTFPSPVSVGKRGVRWHKDEIYEWIASRPRTYEI